MGQKRLNIIIGIICVILAIVVLNFYITNERKKMAEALKRAFTEKYRDLVSVLVAKRDIPVGAEITADMLESKIIPKRYVEPQAATSLDKVTGKKTVVPIKKGEQIILSKLTSAVGIRPTKKRSLAMATPVGKRAITVKVDNIAGLAGMIKPGDYVDVIALIPIPAKTPEGKQVTQTATLPLFQNVLVLAVGKEIGGKEERGSKAGWMFGNKFGKKDKTEGVTNLITLALAPQEASLLSFVSEQGKIRLVLRSPADAKVQPLPPASWDMLFQYVNSLLPQKRKEIKQPKKIEIYRGLNKDYITLSE
jgi:pilus assembly protein CpaB